MKSQTVFVLIPSPLTGDDIWAPAAHALRERGAAAVIAGLQDVPGSEEPYWQQQARSAARVIEQIPPGLALILAGYSGAGPLLPAIREAIAALDPACQVAAYLFVDAGLPSHAATRLDLIRAVSPELGRQFEELLLAGGRYPNWSAADLEEAVPDPQVRAGLMAHLRPRGLDFFSEPLPVFDGWPDAPCGYLRFSPGYAGAQQAAQARGWPSLTLDGQHFHFLVEPGQTAEGMLRLVNLLQ